MRTFHIDIVMGNDDFQFPNDWRYEVARILGTVVKSLDRGDLPKDEDFHRPLGDINGNRVGWVSTEVEK